MEKKWLTYFKQKYKVAEEHHLQKMFPVPGLRLAFKCNCER
jgi:hypothetical protein